MSRCFSAEKRECDDFGDRFTMQTGEVVYDAALKGYNGFTGMWAIMTQKSFEMNGDGRLGLGFGQKYVRNVKMELCKMEG